jgi:hypothetical protein
MPEIQWFKFVPHNELIIHLANGWVVADDLYGTNHGIYACLMVWTWEGEPNYGR